MQMVILSGIVIVLSIFCMCSWNIRHRLICAQICTFRGLSKLLISHFQVDSRFASVSITVE